MIEHGLDSELFHNLLKEALPDDLKQKAEIVTRPCTVCGQEITDVGIDLYRWDNIDALETMAVKAGILAGWDGKNGCWNSIFPNRVAMYDEVKASMLTSKFDEYM